MLNAKEPLCIGAVSIELFIWLSSTWGLVHMYTAIWKHNIFSAFKAFAHTQTAF